MELTPTSSFWASTDPEELRSGEAASAGLVQTVTLSAPPCSGGLERPTSYPGQLPGDDVDRPAPSCTHRGVSRVPGV